jgi:uncharacterized membrane protein
LRNAVRTHTHHSDSVENVRSRHRLRSNVTMIGPRLRLGLSAIAGAAVFALLPTSLSLSIREAMSWNAGALIYLAVVFHVMATSNGDVIRARAARQDDSRVVVLFIILLAICASFVAITGLLSETPQAPKAISLPLVLAAVTIVLAWCVTQVVFTLHYAHEYYRPNATGGRFAGGLDFRSEKLPDYWDFLYFATSIGAASQTSDVSIRTKKLRRLVTVHAVISFFFNTAVLALSINLAATII